MSNVNFWLSDLDTSANADLFAMNKFVDSSFAVGTYDVAFKIDINVADAQKMFRIGLANTTVTTDIATASAAVASLDPLSDADTGFYIQKYCFPDASINYTACDYTAASKSAVNPFIHSAFYAVPSTAASLIADDNVATIPQEFMSYIAHSLFTSAKASAIFNNETAAIKGLQCNTAVKNYYTYLYDCSDSAVGVNNNTMTAAQMLNDSSNNGVDARARNRIARSIFYDIINMYPGRIATMISAGLDSNSNTYGIPIIAGDSFTSFITINPDSSQRSYVFGTGAAPVSRKYRVILNIVTSGGMNSTTAAGMGFVGRSVAISTLQTSTTAPITPIANLDVTGQFVKVGVGLL